MCFSAAPAAMQAQGRTPPILLLGTCRYTALRDDQTSGRVPAETHAELSSLGPGVAPLQATSSSALSVRVQSFRDGIVSARTSYGNACCCTCQRVVVQEQGLQGRQLAPGWRKLPGQVGADCAEQGQAGEAVCARAMELSTTAPSA